ncbi:hypothetical protein EJ04DRAFT_441769 [Polyplosphaeria fusca]|uniref:Bromo domain-containing protein n=1 Tax=Polyplosphaeria fusca TaxID=682080 RepID=A0A9P4QVS7_9PLEO|nr:hypothetical protein EJ04DRAFT_441769 [Polyplosphaeria fusca]
MNTSLTAYTHLESLLLFQSLATHGVDTSSFSRISDLLKRNPHITADKRFEPGRLSPDALRNFYLLLLKEEIKSERHDGLSDVDGQNGDARNTRKRKAASPSLPTVQEAAQHYSLMPKLVERLYARYRSAITAQIREDELRYDRLQRELQEIERGEWDDHLSTKANGTSSAPRSPSLSRKSPLPLQKHASPRKKQALPEQHGLSSTPKATPGPIPSPQQARDNPPIVPQPPIFSAPQPTNSAYHGSPLAVHHSPYPPPGHREQTQVSSAGLPLASPHAPTTPHPSQTHSTTGAPFQPPPIQPYGGNGIPPYASLPGTSPQFSPAPQRYPVPYQSGPSPAKAQTPQQQRAGPSSTPGLQTYPGPPHQPPVGHPPPQGGFMLPPFQVSPQDPSRTHPQPAPPPHSQVSTPASGRHGQPSTRPVASASSSSRPGLPPIFPPIGGKPSFSTPVGLHTPQSAVSTPRSAKTLWKPSTKISAPSPVPRPPVSPIDDVEPLKPSKQGQQKAKPVRKPRVRAKGKEKDPEPDTAPEQETVEDVATELETRSGRPRRRAATKRTRPGSLASSQAGTSVRERSRSQSIVSHTETIGADTESQTGYRLKVERDVSVDVIEEDPAGTPSHPSTRRRGGATRNGKRKRDVQEASPVEGLRVTPGLSRTVIAPRHFSRMCNPIMNDIGSHKHASIFTTAVRAKDAEGYYEIVKKPTDLKTIQKAINAGAKAVAAAASDTPAGSPGGGGGVVELPLTEQVSPPNAIVNSSQLEKELMRMFANAVMFNAGEEGVVEDAREMFETIEKSVSTWRNVERASGRSEIEETPVPEPDDEPAKAPKRRKV